MSKNAQAKDRTLMTTATIATAAGAAALLYYTLNKKVETIIETEDDDGNSIQRWRNARLGIDRVSRRLIQAPD
ncbi:hypothetical protein AgCh_015411 [Apium graveolens]